jgi:hypothetical protein
LREQDRLEHAAALENAQREFATIRERERQEFGEAAERKEQELGELREQDRLEHAAALENAHREFATIRERERQEYAAALENARSQSESLHERNRQELAEAVERGRQQFTELREHDRQEFTESLAAARQELDELRERNRQEFALSLDRERREFADRLRQAVRRIRQSNSPEELASTLVDAAAGFAGAAGWLRVMNGDARGGPIRGVSEESAEAFRALDIPLANAAALAGAVESRDPVIAAVADTEVSPLLLKLPEHPTEGRVAIFPLVTREGVPGLLYTWGKGQEAVLEMLTQVAAAGWETRTPPPPVPDLVRIAPVEIAAVPAVADTRSAWERLSPEEQQIHLRAQRYARVQAAEMRLHEADAVESGRARRNLYDVLQRPIDQARATFHLKFFIPCPSMVDYLHLELVRTLANDDVELLGTDYPGPLV